MSNYLRSSRYSSPASTPAASGSAGAGSRLRRDPSSSVTLGASLPAPTSTTASVSGEYGGGGRVIETNNVRIGSNVCFVRSVVGVCGGLIGAGSKFCIRSSGSCSVESHRKRPNEALAEGFYVLYNENEALSSPFIPTERLSEDVMDQLLEKQFQDNREVIRFFEHVRSSDNIVVDSIKELEERDRDMKVSLFAKTPSLKGKRAMKYQYEELLTGFKNLDTDLLSTTGSDGDDDTLGDVDSTSVSPTKWASQVSSFLQVIVNTLSEDQSAIDILSDKTADLSLQVGIPPPAFGIERLPPSLWSGVVQLIEDFDKYRAEMNLKLHSIDQSSNREDAMALEARVNYNLQNLAIDSKKAIQSVEENLQELQGSDLDMISDTYHSVAACSRAIDNSNSRIDEAFKVLESLQKSHSAAGKQKLLSINIGRHTFHGYDDLSAWMEEKLPPEFPFGAFCDVYSYLQRVVSFKDSVGSSGLKDMELRSKMKMTACESIVLDSFKHPLPRIFNSGSSGDSGSTGTNAWLPGIPTKSRWEDAEALSGAKITIKDNEEVVRSRLEAVITERLSSHEEAQSLARQLLSDTIAFVTAMNRFISETHLRLENAGFGTDRSWQLVSKLVHRLFANDCHNHRGRVSEILDASDRRVLSVGVLWAVFSTHQIMREYMRYGIENHPSIASEYVRFLVAHSALPKVEAVNSKLVKVQDSLSTLSNKIKTLEKDAKTAANKADEALKFAKNKK